jgi:hypothetical protein
MSLITVRLPIPRHPGYAVPETSRPGSGQDGVPRGGRYLDDQPQSLPRVFIARWA